MKPSPIASLYILAFALLALFSGELRLWGLAHAAPAAHILLGLALLAALLYTFQRFHAKDGPPGDHEDGQAGKQGEGHGDFTSGPAPWLPIFMRRGIGGAALTLLLSLSAVAVFHTFRMQLFLPPPLGLGDSLQLVENIPVFAELFGYLDSFDDMLSIYFRSKAYLLLSKLPAEQSLGMVSTIAGGFYITLVWIFLRDRSPRDMLLGLALLVLTPGIQLYFGYVENYTLLCLYVSLLLMTTMGLLRNTGRPSLIALVALGALSAWALLHHVAAAFLLPALIFLVWLHAAGDRKQFLRGALLSGGAAAIVLASFWTYFLFLSDNPVIFADSHVAHPPILPPRKVFSSRHIVDLLNRFLLAAPVALFLLGKPILDSFRAVFRGAGGLKERLVRARGILAPDPIAAFLGIAVLSFFIDAFLHNPKIGYPADWDLMTLFVVPLNLYVFHMATRKPAGKGSVPRAALLLVLASVLTTAWILRNASGGPRSTENLQRAKALTHRAVRDISSSPVYLKLKDKHRRKQFTRIELFILRSELQLNNRSDPPSREILAKLTAARPRFLRVMELPDTEYKPAFESLWNDLAKLNQRMAEMR